MEKTLPSSWAGRTFRFAEVQFYDENGKVLFESHVPKKQSNEIPEYMLVSKNPFIRNSLTYRVKLLAVYDLCVFLNKTLEPYNTNSSKRMAVCRIFRLDC